MYDVTVDIEEAGSSPVSAMTWVFSNLLAFRVSEKYCGQVIITGRISQSLDFKKSSTVIAMININMRPLSHDIRVEIIPQLGVPGPKKVPATRC